MRVVSLSVGGPREVELDGGTVLTSIFKTPPTGGCTSPCSTSRAANNPTCRSTAGS
jgi:hypothetical protein